MSSHLPAPLIPSLRASASMTALSWVAFGCEKPSLEKCMVIRWQMYSSEGLMMFRRKEMVTAMSLAFTLGHTCRLPDLVVEKVWDITSTQNTHSFVARHSR